MSSYPEVKYELPDGTKLPCVMVVSDASGCDWNKRLVIAYFDYSVEPYITVSNFGGIRSWSCVRHMPITKRVPLSREEYCKFTHVELGNEGWLSIESIKDDELGLFKDGFKASYKLLAEQEVYGLTKEGNRLPMFKEVEV